MTGPCSAPWRQPTMSVPPSSSCSLSCCPRQKLFCGFYLPKLCKHTFILKGARSKRRHLHSICSILPGFSPFQPCVVSLAMERPVSSACMGRIWGLTGLLILAATAFCLSRSTHCWLPIFSLHVCLRCRVISPWACCSCTCFLGSWVPVQTLWPCLARPYPFLRSPASWPAFTFWWC